MRNDALVSRLQEHARPLASEADLDPLLDRIGDARFVLLGEATHGTSEFYSWRADITRRLVEERGFSFVAVEGDWPDCMRVNRWIKRREAQDRTATDVLEAFARWPTWMWANREVAALAEWLREHNGGVAEHARVGFYGLDVYSLWDSIAAVERYLGDRDPALAAAARRAYRCFDPYHDDAQEYARATALVPTSCENEAIAVLAALRSRPASGEDDRESQFDAEQNALVARNAERYYRTMVRGGPGSWNVRDRHMVETLERLMTLHGPDAKAIVWEHNTHVGDARFTDMASNGMVNVGQLVREAHGEDDVVIVGFGTHRGTVIAGGEWGAPMRRVRVPRAREGTFEDLMHRALDGRDGLLLFDGSPDGGIRGLDVTLAHRAIGVVYDPDFERWGNYVPTLVPRRYDAFLYLDETHALDALHLHLHVDGEVPETYPSGM